jgi:hypothetical protein
MWAMSTFPPGVAAFWTTNTLQLVDLLFTVPKHHGDFIFTMFVDASIVCSALILGLRPWPGALYQVFAPAVRVQVLICISSSSCTSSTPIF